MLAALFHPTIAHVFFQGAQRISNKNLGVDLFPAVVDYERRFARAYRQPVETHPFSERRGRRLGNDLRRVATVSFPVFLSVCEIAGKHERAVA